MGSPGRGEATDANADRCDCERCQRPVGAHDKFLPLCLAERQGISWRLVENDEFGTVAVTGVAGASYSGLMFAGLIMGVHFSISAL
jgi:hypothetical protein